MSSATKVYELSGGELALWAEPGSSVMLKFADDSDPLELGEGEVKELIGILNELLNSIS